MMNAFSLNVSNMGFLGGVKAAEVHTLSVYHDCRLKFLAMPVHSEQFGRVVFSGFDFVLGINQCRNIAKIAKAIIVLHPVSMVNIMFGKFSCHVKPSNAMSTVIFGIDHDFDVSTVMRGTTSSANFVDVACGFNSGEKASFRVVMKQFFETFLSKHVKPFISRFASSFEVGQDGDESSFQPLNLAQRFNFTTI